MGMHLVHSGPVVTHRSASRAQPAGQQVCANAGDISAYAKTRTTSFRYPMRFSPAKHQLKRARFVSLAEPPSISRVANQANRDAGMAKAKKQTSRGRNQDRARVAVGQDYEVRYDAK